VFRAYFSEGSDIGARDVLLTAAVQTGLDPAELTKALDEGRYSSRLMEARKTAETFEVGVVPTFIINESRKVVGAQSLEVFRKALSAG
jgi:predicted DsbA family dithiol-disulfide isomerase